MKCPKCGTNHESPECGLCAIPKPSYSWDAFSDVQDKREELQAVEPK